MYASKSIQIIQKEWLDEFKQFIKKKELIEFLDHKPVYSAKVIPKIGNAMLRILKRRKEFDLRSWLDENKFNSIIDEKNGSFTIYYVQNKRGADAEIFIMI